MKTLQQLLMKKKTQRSDTERNNLIEEGKIKGINKIISQNA